MASDASRTPAEDGAPARSQAQIAYEQIKSSIIDGNLAPGSSLSEPQLAATLHMSRTPVHQAVVRLESEEWLTVSARRGLRIADLDPAAMRDVYEVLIGLEGTAAALLAGRTEGVDAVDQELGAACRRCEQALAAGDLAAWLDADADFHGMLVARCGNVRLSRVFELVSEHAHRARVLTLTLRPWPEKSDEDHQRILAAIADRSPGDARAALEAHRRRGIATLAPLLEAIAPRSGTFSLPPR